MLLEKSKNPNKTSYRIFDSGQGSSVETWKLESNIDIGEHTKKSDKNNKKSKRLELQGEITEIRINYF